MAYKRAWAEINLDNLAHNYRIIRKRIPAGSGLMGIVKADAYGHGSVEVADTLLDCGADALGVAICEEGIVLRESGIHAPILVMGFTPPPLVSQIVKHNLIQTIFSLEGAKTLSETAARLNKRAAIHIEIDTGMSRLGFLPNNAGIDAICEIANDPNLYIQGIYTHYATSDQLDHEFMHQQEQRFGYVLDALAGRGVHVHSRHRSNSGALAQVFRFDGDTSPQKITDGIFSDIARIGIMLYGLPPSAEMGASVARLGLKPVMRLMAQVSMVKKLEAGVGISYGHMYKTNRETTIAVLPIGYADGYPRRLSNGGQVLVGGKLAPIAGAICMDQCMIDITDIPNVAPGDHVVLLGSQEEGISADHLADIVGTISYEVVCGIGKRIPRQYVKNVLSISYT